MFLILLSGLAPGILVLFLIHMYEKKDTSIGKLSLPIDGIVLFLGVAYVVCGCYAYGFIVIPILSVAVNTALLLFTAYTDIRCGQVYVFYAYISAFVEALIVLYLVSRKVVSFVDIKYLLLFVAVTFLFVLFGLARADGVIYLSCILSLLIVCRTYFVLAVLMLFLVSSVLAFVFNMKRLTKKEWKKRFPFTAYIASGCLVSYFLFSFLVYT